MDQLQFFLPKEVVWKFDFGPDAKFNMAATGAILIVLFNSLQVITTARLNRSTLNWTCTFRQICLGAHGFWARSNIKHGHHGSHLGFPRVQ